MADTPPPMPEKKGGIDMGNLFASKPKAQVFDMTEVVSEVTNVSRRLRILEERYTNFRRKVQVIETNMLANQKKVMMEIKTVSSDVADIKNTLHEIENRMLMMVKELRTCAKKDEVQVLQKYLQYWEPLNFVTHKELDEKFDEQEGKPKVPFPEDM
jgi:hypothetical protein